MRVRRCQSKRVRGAKVMGELVYGTGIRRARVGRMLDCADEEAGLVCGFGVRADGDWMRAGRGDWACGGGDG